MAGYTRQSTSQIINGANITAPPLNAEFNQLASSFGVTGHTHDGTSGNAPKIDLATSVTGYLPATNGGTGGKNNLAATTNPGNGDDADDGYSRGSYWYNYTGDRWYICINNTVGSAVWREMLMVETGSVIEPGITGAVDLGSTTFKFKDTHLSGSMNSVSAAISGNMTVGGTQTNTGAATFNGSATFSNITNFTGAANTIANAAITSGTINGTTIGGATAAAGTFTALTANTSANLTNATISGGTINNSVIGGTTPLNITGLTVAASTGFSGDLTGNVSGNVTGNLTGAVTGGVTGDVTGNVTASSGSSTFNNVVINGSLDMDATTASTITGLSTPVNPTDASTKAYVDQQVALVLSSAPAALDTLNELAAAINDDANFATTVNNSIATKLSLSGGTMTGNIDLDSTNKITNMPTPSANSDGSNKGYVDTQRDTRLATTGGTMSGAINMNSQAITSLANPANSGDAANKFYVDSILGSATSAAASASTASALAAQASGSAANAQASEDEAQEWATKTTGTVTGESEYSAKEYAIGTVIRGNIGSAKDWSTYTGGTVDGTNYSAKYWATNANIGTIASNIDDLVNVANDLSSGNFVAGQIYDFGAITDAATGTSGAPDGFIVTVANNLADVQTVANDITNVNTLAGISSNIATLSVAQVVASIPTVAGISSDVTTAAGNSANITTVAGVSSDVTAVANNNANINTVVGQITPNNNISTLASIAGNISTVASVSVDVTTVAGISSNVTAVANNNANVTSVANIDSDVTAVAGIASDVTTAATNVTDITNFSDVYQGPKSSAPTQRNNNSSLVAGDLYFDTTSGFMRYYSGSSWVNITAPTGDMGNQNSTSVAITGGSITGITDLEIADGGTGASSAPAARTNLGLDTMATQAANNVAITGGTISVDFDFGSI